MGYFSKEFFKKVSEGTELEKITGGYKIGSDREKNRLFLVFIGYFDEDVGSKFAKDTITEIKKLRKNHDVIADMSEFRVANKEGEAYIKETMDFAANAGERYSVRVGQRIKMGTVQLQKTVEGITSVDMKPKGYFNTFHEAETYLEELIQESKVN